MDYVITSQALGIRTDQDVEEPFAQQSQPLQDAPSLIFDVSFS